VVLCTGFRTHLPFYTANPKLDGRDLYKNVFLPGESALAFIGFARPNVGALPPVAELQARWFAGVVAGKLHLPNAELDACDDSGRTRHTTTAPVPTMPSV
jgi:dimethylaniline monooxygenase (N-oxide forming)